MAAGLGFKTFTTGEVLTAADTNGYLMQGVLVFASAAARDAAITSPQEGQYCYLKDTNSTQYYDGAAWVSGVEGDISGVTAGIGISGGGTSGTVTVTNSMATAIDAKGDLIGGTGADTFARLAVGVDDLLLTAASGETTGLKYTGGWTTYTPTYSNITVGNGTVDARWCRIGKMVFVYYRLVFGSTSSIGSSPYFTLPTGSSYPQRQTTGVLKDQGVSDYVGIAQIEGSNVFLGSFLASGTYGTIGAVSATVPFTWGNTDSFFFFLSYEG